MARLLDAEYAVISIDQRGHGDSGGQIRILDPDFEGKDLIQILDWAEANWDWLYRSGNLVLGATGQSYGGGFQHTILAHDPQKRLDALAPEITWHDLRYSLFSGMAFKSFWTTFLSFVGNATPGGQHQGVNDGLVNGLTNNNLTQQQLDLLKKSSLISACEAGTLDPVDALYWQSASDTLFNLNEVAHNFACLDALPHGRIDERRGRHGNASRRWRRLRRTANAGRGAGRQPADREHPSHDDRGRGRGCQRICRHHRRTEVARRSSYRERETQEWPGNRPPKLGGLHNPAYRTLSCKPQMKMSGFSKVEMSALPPLGRDRGDGDVDHGGTGTFGSADAACRAAADAAAGRGATRVERAAGLNDPISATPFLPQFMADYNARFAKPPRLAYDAHRPLRPDEDLDQIFTWQETRQISRQLTVNSLANRRAARTRATSATSTSHAELDPGTVVEHKHLDGAFAWIAAQQQARDAQRLASPKLTRREKQLLGASPIVP